MVNLLHFLLHTILLCSIYIPSSTAISSIAKPNCPTQCGNINIPYPFGIGPGCYVDEWFEILCLNNNNTTTAFLNRTKLEVLEISLQGTLMAKNPITFSNCSDKQTIQSPNFEGTPFFYSQNNRFTALSCGALALMIKSSGGGSGGGNSFNESTIGGCMSVCDEDSIRTTTNVNSCNGMNCCQTTIPSYLKAFNTTFQAIEADERSREGCKYAFMVDKDWSFRNLSSIREMDYVPVVIEWELYYSTSELFGKSIETNRTTTTESTNDYCDKINITDQSSADSESEICIRNSYCETYNDTFSVYNRSRIQCFCGEGFEGNPYLVEGCQDINECEVKPQVCINNDKCENRPGTYRCYSPSKKSLLKRIYDGIVNFMGLMFLLACPWWIKKSIKKRSKKHLKEKFFKRNGGFLLQQQLSSNNEANVEKTKLFNSKELEKATNSFSTNRILGQGGQGTVYKGMLADGKIVAVKKSKKVSENKVAEFINEVVILSQINHRNVVKLLGCCLETEVPILVYEFIPNGTLFDYIHDQNDDFQLTWETRLRIATEIAGAFSYLHSSASYPIYHRDIKSTNILLDEKYRSKIADFGTSRTLPIDKTHLTTLVHGTFGYLDPEYFQSSKFTDKSDVYSFGVVMVELLTGQKPISVKSKEKEEEEEEARSLATYFIECMEENRLFDIVDGGIIDKGNNIDEEIKGVATLAKRCLNLNGRNRPTMKEVAMELESIQKSVESQQNFEEVEYIRNKRTESYNDVSISIGSSSDSGYTSSIDVVPLLYRTHQSEH